MVTGTDYNFNAKIISKCQELADTILHESKTDSHSCSYSGHNYHAEEIEAAKHLANHGYRVELQPEGMRMWASAWRNGNSKYAEGTIEGTLYDQKTVSRSATNLVGNVRNSLNHAVEKNAKVALIYDPHDKLHRGEVRTGIKDFMKYPHNQGKLDSVDVVNSSGRLYIHKLK